jgi:ribosome-associated translation inhibitor RaiA
MIIQVNSDSHVDGNVNVIVEVEQKVQRALERYAERITRVEVHLNDENAHKSGPNDQRCLMEARVNGLQPIAVTHKAPTLEQAVDGAADRLKNALDNALGKLERR